MRSKSHWDRKTVKVAPAVTRHDLIICKTTVAKFVICPIAKNTSLHSSRFDSVGFECNDVVVCPFLFFLLFFIIFYYFLLFFIIFYYFLCPQTVSQTWHIPTVSTVYLHTICTRVSRETRFFAVHRMKYNRPLHLRMTMAFPSTPLNIFKRLPWYALLHQHHLFELIQSAKTNSFS
jgi:hypothetical protein